MTKKIHKANCGLESCLRAVLQLFERCFLRWTKQNELKFKLCALKIRCSAINRYFCGLKTRML